MTNLKKDVLQKRLLNSVKYLYLSLRLVWSLFTCKKVWKQMWKQAQGTKKVVEGSNVYDWPCFLFANAMTSSDSWLWNDFLERALRIKTNNIIAVFFFFLLIFIQLCDSRKIHYLTREFHVKLHLKTDIARIAIGFRVQFNVEFPRQVMNFPIEWGEIRHRFMKNLYEVHLPFFNL